MHMALRDAVAEAPVREVEGAGPDGDQCALVGEVEGAALYYAHGAPYYAYGQPYYARSTALFSGLFFFRKKNGLNFEN